MDELNDVVKILEEEYGIRSMADLDDAITKLGFFGSASVWRPHKSKGEKFYGGMN